MGSMAKHRFQGVVFDLDGTLVDSAPDLHAALNRLLAAEGRPPVTLDAVKTMVGDGVGKLVERGFQATGEVPPAPDLEAAVQRFTADYEQNATELTSVYPGAREALSRLHGAGLPLGLCTNKPQLATETLLDHLDLARYMKAVVGGDAVAGVRKPDPRHVLAVLDRLGVAARDAVLIGDSPADIGGAIAAGIPAVAVSFGYPKMPVEDLGADIIIDTYDELEPALASLS